MNFLKMFFYGERENGKSWVPIWLGRVIVGCLSRWRYQMRSQHEVRGAGGGLEALFKQASIWSGPSGIRILDQDLGEKDVRIGPTLATTTTYNTRPIKQQTDTGGQILIDKLGKNKSSNTTTLIVVEPRFKSYFKCKIKGLALCTRTALFNEFSKVKNVL